MLLRAIALGWSVVLASCGMCGSAPTAQTPGTPTVAPVVTPTAQQEPAAPEPTGPPPRLRVIFEPDPLGGEALRVENRGEATVQVRAFVDLELSSSGDFAPTPTQLRIEPQGASSIVLNDGDAPECLDLVAGGALVMPPWDYVIRPARCPEQPAEDLDAGTYRYVVQSCDERHPFASPAFTLGHEDLRPSAPCAR